MQPTLFESHIPVPKGFCFRTDFISEEEEVELLGYFEDLPFEQSTSGIYGAKRRHLNLGWGYDFRKECLVPGPPLPPFLMPLKRKVAKWLDISSARIVEALITEYPQGASIMWHRDNEKFESIVGISLASWCRLRLRPIQSKAPPGKRRAKDVWALSLPARSAYLLQKESRWHYQHSIAAVPNLRYSITFRTLSYDQLVSIAPITRRRTR